jgi:hypothetical protein
MGMGGYRPNHCGARPRQAYPIRFMWFIKHCCGLRPSNVCLFSNKNKCDLKKNTYGNIGLFTEGAFLSLGGPFRRVYFSRHHYTTAEG